MTPKQLAAYIAQLDAEADILRKAQKVIAKLAGARATHALPAKLRQAVKLREPGSHKDKEAVVLEAAERLTNQGLSVTPKALIANGIALTTSGVLYHLKRAGYRRVGRAQKTVWVKSATKAKTKLNGAAKKGHMAETLAAIVKQAGKPMAFGELQAAAQQMGMRVNAQAFAAACRYKYLKRDGDSYTLGRNGQGAAL